MAASQESLARAIGWVLRKGYEDLLSTMNPSKKKSKKTSPGQISQQLSTWEDSLADKKKKIDEL